MGDNILDAFDLDSFDFEDFDSLETGVSVKEQPVETPEVENIVTFLRKRAMVVFFVVDISGSMRGARIGAVNDAIRNVLPELRKREKGNTSAEIRVALLTFSSDAYWQTLVPQPVWCYEYNDIDWVGGGTNFGKAFAALNEKLSRKQFLKSTAGAYTPLIIFMTDGKPSDIGMYPQELEKLKRNKWFQYATRAGIAIEEGALSPECRKVLLEFTENENNIYEARNTMMLAKQIELVTLTGVDFVTRQGSVQNSAAQAEKRQSLFTSGSAMPSAAASSPERKDAAASSLSGPANERPGNSSPVPAEIGSAGVKSSTASPTLPIEEIDWDNDFDF